MTSLIKYFPVLLGIQFISAASDVEVLRSYASYSRWGMLFLSVLLLLFIKRKPSLRNGLNIYDAIIYIIIGICFLSALWSIDFKYTVARTGTLVLMYVCAFWFMWYWTDIYGPERLLKYSINTIGFCLVINMTGFIFYSNAIFASRYKGYLENPNTVAILCGFAVPIMLLVALYRPKLVNKFYLFVAVLSLFLSGGRAGIGAAAIGCVLTLYFSKSRYRVGLIAVSIFIFTIGAVVKYDAMSSYFKNNVLRIDSINDLSNRQVIWDKAKEYIEERPNFGFGYGTDIIIHEYHNFDLKSIGFRGVGVSSAYYGVAIQLGIWLAWCFFISMWIFALYNLYLGIVNKDIALVAFSSVLVGGLLMAFTEPWITSVGNAYAWFYWMIFMLVVRDRVTEKRRIEEEMNEAVPGHT